MTNQAEVNPWGPPGGPLVPVAFLDLWGTTRLPQPLSGTLKDFAVGAPALSATQAAALQKFLLLKFRSEGAWRSAPLIGQSWPDALSTDQLLLSKRTRRVLIEAGLLSDGQALVAEPIARFRDLPGLGHKGTLELASAAEYLLDLSPNTASGAPRPVPQVDGAEAISNADPRFSDVIADVPGNLAEYLQRSVDGIAAQRRRTVHFIEHRLPAVLARMAAIRAMPLERALSDFLGALGLTDDQITAMQARLGWAGSSPATLQEAAEILETTREWIRLLEVRVTVAASNSSFLPALDKALDALSRVGTAPDAEASALLRAEGITEAPFAIDSVVQVAEMFGRHLPFERRVAGAGSFVVGAHEHVSVADVAKTATRSARKTGIAHVDSVARAIGLDPEADRGEIQRLVEQSINAQFIGTDWFWIPSASDKRNVVQTATRAMLSVAGSLDIHRVREGVRRRFKARGLSPVPPTDVLLAYYDQHPSYVVAGDRVAPATALSTNQVLEAVERKMVDILRAAPTGALTRHEFNLQSLAAGITQPTFDQYTSYSPVLEHPATDVWTLRGTELPTDLALGPGAGRVRQPRVMAWGRHTKHLLWIGWRLPEALSSVVLGVPADILRYLGNRSFRAIDDDGVELANITVDARGLSWGYGRHLRHLGAEAGDVLRATFHLDDDTVDLTIESEEVLLPDNLRIGEAKLTIDLAALLEQEDEDLQLELKETARVDNEKGELFKPVEIAWVKTVAAFLNTGGGILLIGVDDSKRPLGLGADMRSLSRPHRDGFQLYLRTSIKKYLGSVPGDQVGVYFPKIDGVEICALVVAPSEKAIFLVDEGKETFYVRTGNGTEVLTGSDLLQFGSKRFRARP